MLFGIQRIVIVLAACGILAGEVTAGEPQAEAVPAPALEARADGTFAIGAVTLDPRERLVRFPARINMTNGVIEYAIVGSAGKLHESLLVTEAEPYHIHLAMLFLGATNRVAAVGPANVIAGESVQILVKPQGAANAQAAPIESWVLQEEKGNPMPAGTWIYNGSKVVNGRFIAQVDQSIASIIQDPSALINAGRPGSDDDEIWFPNGAQLPGLRVAVDVELRLMPARREVPIEGELQTRPEE